MFEAFSQACSILFSPTTLELIFLGTLLGLAVGILPGLGGAASLALCLPFIWKRPPEIALPLLVALQATVFVGGGITSILMNIPGEATSACTLVDGFPMNQKGEGSRALGAQITSSMMAGVIAVPMALLMIPVILPIVMRFRSPEIFVMILMGIMFIAVLSSGSVLKGLISGCLGILFGFVGMHEVTGIPRFTFGSLYLYNGLHIATVIVGWFGLAEMVELVMTKQTSISKIEITRVRFRDVVIGMKDVLHHWNMWLRSTLIGYILGALPGIGPGTAVWIAYGQAKQTSKNPEKFGTGCVEGVIAPEAAESASTAGALLRTMAFGVPGSVGTAVLLGAFIMVGVNPGPIMMAKHLPLVFTLLIGVAVANVMAGLICLVSARSLAKIAYVHIDILYPVVLTIIFVASYVADFSMIDVAMVIVMGFLGIAMNKFGYSRPALALGFVLGGLFEYYFFRSVLTSGYLFFLTPICMVMLVILVSLFVYPYMKNRRRSTAEAGRA